MKTNGDEPVRSEFERLRQRQSELQEELSRLARQLERLEVRLDAPETRAELLADAAEAKSHSAGSAKSAANGPKAVSPPPIPSNPSPVAVPPLRAVEPGLATPVEPLASSSPAALSSFRSGMKSRTGKDEPAERSFEMRLGTYWLVRVGIVMLLTGLVFFANYAYQNFIGKLGSVGKVSLLYMASAVLLGAGAWWQRRPVKEALRNYAQVLFAGGLAAVYFTTYAAHHLANLRIIDSPLLDGALLLAWTGFMVWIAERKKSEVLALFAVGLAYYTAIITRVGTFTLFSNLVLTLAAVLFLVRNRWVALSFASVVATYAAYGFWRFSDGSQWRWTSPAEGLWLGASFLIGYWLLFTAAVFLSRHPEIAGRKRATFLTLNNTEFFVMFLLTMLQVGQGGFWRFALIYGAVLLGLAVLARRLLNAELLTQNTYLTQGVLLVTVGLIAKFSGVQLALLLGAESVVLFTLGSARCSRVLEVGSYLAGALAVGVALSKLARYDTPGLLADAALGGLMVFNAYWSHCRSKEEKSLLRPVPGYFSVLALLIWGAATWSNVNAANFPLVLALEALVLTASLHLLRLRELTVLGQGYLLIAHVAWLMRFGQPDVALPWWNPALMIAITLGLSHWWQKQRSLDLAASVRWVWQGAYGSAVVGVLYFWLTALVSAPAWLALAGLLGVGMTAYAVITQAWSLAACGQILVWVSAGQFAWQLVHKRPEWGFALVPVFALGFLSFSTVKWFQRHPDADADADAEVRTPLLHLALVYRWAALFMTLWWINEYIPARQRIWVLALLGLVVFLWAGWRRNAEALLISGVLTGLGFGLFWLPLHGAATVYWPNLLAVLALLGQQHIARRAPSGSYALDARAPATMIGLGSASLWLFLYRWLGENATGFYLTASWSVLALALFLCGIGLRERMYRWMGLGVLATAVGRVFLFDVWKLETVYRILSFMALGIVLLVLGFIYNKYQEKIKEWL